MNLVKAAACNPNDIDYFFKKNSISQSEKKCLAFRGSLQKASRINSCGFKDIRKTA